MLRFGVVVVVAAAVVGEVHDAHATDPRRLVSQYVHRHYGSREGLSHNLANSLVQLPDGYLWAGSEQGLTRFDGHRFVVFDRSDGLPTNTISVLARVGDTLWIGTRERGLAVRDHGAITTISDPAIGAQIRAITVDATGDVWVGTRDRGVARLHAGHVVAALRVADGLPSDDIRKVAVMRDGSLWIGTFAGAAHVSNGRVVGVATELAGAIVYAITEDQRGQRWFGTSTGLWRQTGTSLSRVELPGPTDPAVLHVLADRDGNLWIGRSIGLQRRSDDGHIETLNGFDVRILALLEDRQGDLWIGSEGGLDELVDGDVLPLAAAEGLTDQGIYGVLEDRDGVIWASGENGLFRKPPGVAATNVAPDRGTVYAIYEDASGDIWAGARDGSVGRWHDDRFTWLGTGTWEKVRGIAAAPGGLWLGTDHGLFRVTGDRIDRAAPVVAGPIISAIAIDREGLWLGSEGHGLLHVTETGVPLAVPVGGPPSNSSVVTLAFDVDGSLWAGTEGDGLWRLSHHRWTSITTANGLYDNLVWTILDDGQGGLWMSSNRGIWRAPRAGVLAVETDPTARFSSRAYGEADGMRTAECDGAVMPPGWRTRSGRLLFPTSEGVAQIDPAHLRHDAPQPAIVETLRVDGKPVPLSSELVMPPGSSRLEIEYTAAELRVAEHTRFRYKLEPFDSAWNDAGAQRVAQYTNLAPGSYRFVVTSAFDGDDTWSTETVLELSLEPRFYQMLWFKVAAAVGAVALLLSLPLLRVRQLRLRERELAERVAEALRDVKTLSGLIPICAWCKKIRDDKGYWSRLEQYIGTRTDAKFTHGICPTCVAKQEQEDEA